ncbi:MAG: hypothetical protein C5B59_12790 [Bacteroidetes bacterium]|nr:MAG: hypothetical protein C5B59_12790 [Bacteroidota bacterium]
MIFNLANLYGQEDPRWADEKTGNATPADATLKLDGCAVTAIANLHNAAFGTNLTPHDVNQALIANEGFVYDKHGYALLNWINVPKAFPKLYFVFKDGIYDNLRTWMWINVYPKLPVIVQVKLGYNSHFIIFVGNHLMVDSLDGKLKPTSTYPTLQATVRYGRA